MDQEGRYKKLSFGQQQKSVHQMIFLDFWLETNMASVAIGIPCHIIGINKKSRELRRSKISLRDLIRCAGGPARRVDTFSTRLKSGWVISKVGVCFWYSFHFPLSQTLNFPTDFALHVNETGITTRHQRPKHKRPLF